MRREKLFCVFNLHDFKIIYLIIMRVYIFILLCENSLRKLLINLFGLINCIFRFKIKVFQFFIQFYNFFLSIEIINL